MMIWGTTILGSPYIVGYVFSYSRVWIQLDHILLVNISWRILEYLTRVNSEKHNFHSMDWLQVKSSGWWLGHPSEKYEFVNWDD